MAEEAARKLDPFEMFITGEQYRDLASVALKTGKPLLQVPAMVCSAFAFEVYFKSILVQEGLGTRDFHNLRRLFGDLPKAVQTQIRELFDTKYLAKTQQQANEQIQEGRAPPTVDFDYALNVSEEAFALRNTRGD